jgi:4-amino-4-deoxychorismate lyase
MTVDCLVNGQPTGAVGASDRGLRYGDGVFETIAVVDHQPALYTHHLARLRRGCRQLGIDPSIVDPLSVDVSRLALPAFGVLRLTVTRGEGGHGYAPPANPQPTRIVQCGPAPDRPPSWWRDGIRCRWCETRLARQPRLAGVKHLNRLEQVLARAEWDDPAIHEGLMLDTAGYLAEATAANVMLEQGGAVIVPTAIDAGVEGIMQGFLVEQMKAHDIPFEQRPVTADALGPDTSVMLCNSLLGIVPVAHLEDRLLPPGQWLGWLQQRTDDHRVALTPQVLG